MSDLQGFSHAGVSIGAILIIESIEVLGLLTTVIHF